MLNWLVVCSCLLVTNTTGKAAPGLESVWGSSSIAWTHFQFLDNQPFSKFAIPALTCSFFSSISFTVELNILFISGCNALILTCSWSLYLCFQSAITESNFFHGYVIVPVLSGLLIRWMLAFMQRSGQESQIQFHGTTILNPQGAPRSPLLLRYAALLIYFYSYRGCTCCLIWSLNN